MRTQEDNKKERKELKDWKKPEILILDKKNTLSGGDADTAESYPFAPDGS